VTWLVYLLFVFFEPYLAGASAAVWTWSALSVIVFLPLYWLGFSRMQTDPRRARLAMVAVAALGVALIPLNAGRSTYLIYSVALSGFVLRPRYAVLYLLLMAALFPRTVALAGRSFLSWMQIQTVALLVIGAGNIIAGNEIRQRDRAEAETLEMTKLAERERIARDLHDVLGHTLSVIALKAELASKLADSDPQRAFAEIREVERVARETLKEVRTAVEGIRARGLRGELDSASKLLAAAGVALDAQVPTRAMPAQQETVLALALREAVTNVAHHSHASRCEVRLGERDGFLELTVRDDGSGGLPREGNGLAGMRQRVESCGGRLTIDATDGVRLTVAVPFPRALDATA
jgi:two-component system sensor histidine kinase DesK